MLETEAQVASVLLNQENPEEGGSVGLSAASCAKEVWCCSVCLVHVALVIRWTTVPSAHRHFSASADQFQDQQTQKPEVLKSLPQQRLHRMYAHSSTNLNDLTLLTLINMS